MIEKVFRDDKSEFENFVLLLKNRHAKTVVIEDDDCGGVDFDPSEILKGIEALK